MSDRRVRDLHRRWLASNSLADETAWLAERWRVGDPYRFGPFTTRSPAARAVLAAAEAAAKHDRPVVLVGEPTVRAKLARAIHDASARRDGPFARERMDLLPQTLQETELFGYVKSSCFAAPPAFTVRAGRIEQCDGGTLALEVAGASEWTRSKLRRVLVEGETCRVGGQTAIPVDLRWVFEMEDLETLDGLLEGRAAVCISIPLHTLR